VIVDLDEHYSARFEVTDANDALANAGTVTVTVTRPDGTTATPAVTNAGPGLYDIDYLTDAVGRHEVVAVATGGVLGSLTRRWTDMFDVDIASLAIVSAPEAIDHLSRTITITTPKDREQIRWLCSVVTDTIERDLGIAVVKRSVTETFDGGDFVLSLRTLPVISITTVTEGSTVLSAPSGYTLDKPSGQLWRGGTTSTFRWQTGIQNISVTYVAGHLDPSRVLRQVALSGIQRMWIASQQAAVSGLDGAEAVEASAGEVIRELRSAYLTMRVPGA
jgi:hypothetical protein